MTATIRFARLNADSDGPHGGVEHFVASRGLNLLQLDYARPRHIAAPHEAPRELAEYAGGFCDSLRGLGKQLFLEPELRIATSAGWGYAYSCVEAAAKVLVEAGCGEVPISAVRGSNLLPILDYLDSGGVELSHAESGAKWRELKTPVLAADLQLGAGPLATAFAEGARVVVAGCYDAASPLTALAVVEFGWGWEDRDRLAAATLAARSAIWSDSLASGQSVWTNLLASPRPTTCVGIGRDGQFTVETGEPTDAGAAERLAAWLKGTGPNAPGLAHADVHCDASKLACETNGSHQLRISGCGGKKTDGCWRLEALYETGFLAEAIVEFAPQTEAAWRRQTAAAIKRHFHDPDRPELDVAVRELWPADTGTGMSWLHLCCRSKRRQDCQRFVDWTIRWVSASAQRARLPVGRPTVSAELGVWPARAPRSGRHRGRHPASEGMEMRDRRLPISGETFMYMASNPIDVKVHDAAATIILNRPDYGNALTRAMIEQLGEALNDLYVERRVRAIILTGAGNSFSVGADLTEMHDSEDTANPEDQWGADAADFRDLLVQMLEITKPIIAAVNGPALGSGAALVAAADVVVGGEGASFGLPDVRYGMVAGLAAPLVAFRVGTGRTARLMFTSTPIDAAESHRLGLFHEVVPTDKVWARAMEIAKDCAAGAPEAIQLTKRLLNETLGEDLATQLSAGAVMTATARTTEAAEEGIAAMLDGRKPQWK